MITDIKITKPRPQETPKHGYYVTLYWSRLEDAKSMSTETLVGPFPETKKESLIEFLNLLETVIQNDDPNTYHTMPGYDKWFHKKSYKTPLGLHIQTPYDDLDRNREYKLISYRAYYNNGADFSQYPVITKSCPDEIESQFLQNMPQYHFERAMFTETFTETVGQDGCDEIINACIERQKTEDFLFDTSDDEYYIIHLPSGTIINWYKHLGRTNTCNKPGFGIDDLQEMLLLCKKQLTEKAVR